MAVEFLADNGFRLSSNGRSLILKGIAIGKLNSRLSDMQLLALTSAGFGYTDAVEGVVANGGGYQKVFNLNRVPRGGADIAYKFTDDAGVDYWRKGSIMLTPPALYRHVENVAARDHREGLGFVHLEGTERFVTLHLASGFNSLVVCTSADARLSERAARHQKFGTRLVKIHGAKEFASRIAVRTGATRHVVRDIVYSDAKVARGTGEHATEWARLRTSCELDFQFLEQLAFGYTDDLIKLGEFQSVFCKPSAYRSERERRFLFAYETDVAERRVVNDPALRDHIEILI